jgi:hypothetical protein
MKDKKNNLGVPPCGGRAIRYKSSLATLVPVFPLLSLTQTRGAGFYACRPYINPRWRGLVARADSLVAHNVYFPGEGPGLHARASGFPDPAGIPIHIL